MPQPLRSRQFGELLRLQTPAGLDALREQVRSPQFLAKYLRAVRAQEGRQETPKAIFQDNAPVLSCEGLLRRIHSQYENRFDGNRLLGRLVPRHGKRDPSSGSGSREGVRRIAPNIVEWSVSRYGRRRILGRN